MTEFNELLSIQYLGNSLLKWGIAVGVALLVQATLVVLRRLVRTRYRRMAATPQIELAEFLFQVASRTSTGFLLIASLYSGLLILHLPANITRVTHTGFTIVAFWQLGVWATAAVLASLERRQKAVVAKDRAAASSFGIIGFIARLAIWSLVLLLTLDNLGIQIKSLLAGLGIGGIAVALAAQNILGDLFASLSITLDRPFVVGDSLQVDEFSGTVEYIGVKSTRLRSINGEQIIIPNANLLSSRIRNNTRLRERRVVYTLSVDQQTRRDLLSRIPGMLRELITSHRDVRFDRSHFAKIGASSFDIEAVYAVTTPDYGRHMDILQDIHLRLLDIMDREGIALAQPAQKLTMERAADMHGLVQSELIARAGEHDNASVPNAGPDSRTSES